MIKSLSLSSVVRGVRTYLKSGIFVTGVIFALQAVALELPKGDVVLTVKGNLTKTNADGAAIFDMEMLDDLPHYQIETKTPWHDKAHTFSGPLFRNLQKFLGVESEKVRATALNDYAITLPTSDFQKFNVILATRIDGKLISVRDKGPIFVIFPFDQHAELRNEIYYQRSIWQLHLLEFQ